MKVSLWRLFHLWLAIVSAVFLIVASVTGVILAFEPVYEQSHGYSSDAEELTIAQLIERTSKAYAEISGIKKDHNGFYQISILSDEGEETFYFDPSSGQRLGELIKTPELFDFARTLHRSLFFKEIGRFIVGMTALVLVLISVAGFALVVRKQGGLKLYFKAVIKESFFQDYHTQLGKIFIWPVLFVSITGTILFMNRFDIISNEVENHSYDFETDSDEPADPTFSIFQQTRLKDFKELVFPFSDFDDDYFELKLTNRELLINQKTGKVLSQVDYSQGKLWSDFSFKWHTGEGQSWWAILLGLTSVSLLFFVYSGFSIYLKRKPTKSRWYNPFPLGQSETVIAVGSELGATAEKAKAFHSALLEAGIKSHIITLNEFEYSPSMNHLILISSTYGKGDAPANANRFIKKFTLAKDLHSFQYAVAGFGSKAYPDFCQYAMDLDTLLDQHPSSLPLLPIHKIDDNEQEDFDRWVDEVGRKLNIDLEVKIEAKERKTTKLQVRHKKFSENPSDHTFLIELSSGKKKLKGLNSGDLLAITPESGTPRYYSMSVDRARRTILLSVKKHEKGVVSNHLANLSEGELLDVSFKENPSFHFPKKASQVLFIANGTGLAPFIGMLESNQSKTPTTLFWGGQNESSLNLYKPKLDQLTENGKLENLQVAYSRVKENPQYVQQLVEENEPLVTEVLQNQGVIMVCGSLAMLEGVENVLSEISEKHLNQTIDYFKEKSRIKSDCY